MMNIIVLLFLTLIGSFAPAALADADLLEAGLDEVGLDEEFPLAESLWPDETVQEVREGRYSRAADQLESLAQQSAEPGLKELYAWEAERIRRIMLDYSLTELDVRAQLEERYENVTAKEFERWIGENRFDWRRIDGAARFFASTVRNLYFENESFRRRSTKPEDFAFERARARTALQVLDGRMLLDPESGPRRFRLKMTITVPAGEVEAGKTIRCWMPYPRETDYQTGVRLLGAAPAPLRPASNDAAHCALYFEQKSQANAPAIFAATYEYTAKPRYENIDPARVDKFISEEAAAFLKEQPPHVRFLPELAELAESIAGGEARPYEKARRLYDWICENTHYRYAREYSTMPNISRYVHQNRFGDCGQLALLFITLCRLQGIPARWESGWMIYPEGKNLHDWTLIYLHPYGWVPVDPDFGMSAGSDWRGLTEEERRRLQDFYFGRLSAYRLIANCDHGRPHEPAKRYWRSDTVDFQRGELETEDENLYFNRFQYSLEILSDEPAE